jgi:hypothetical protein
MAGLASFSCKSTTGHDIAFLRFGVEGRRR